MIFCKKIVLGGSYHLCFVIQSPQKLIEHHNQYAYASMAEIPRELLEHIIQMCEDKTIGRFACVSKMFLQVATREFKRRRIYLQRARDMLREAVLKHQPQLVKAVLSNVIDVERISLIIQACILCIHHANPSMLSRLIKSFPDTIMRHIYHIVAISQSPMEASVYNELVQFAKNDQQLLAFMTSHQQRHMFI